MSEGREDEWRRRPGLLEKLAARMKEEPELRRRLNEAVRRYLEEVRRLEGTARRWRGRARTDRDGDERGR